MLLNRALQGFATRRIAASTGVVVRQQQQRRAIHLASSTRCAWGATLPLPVAAIERAPERFHFHLAPEFASPGLELRSFGPAELSPDAADGAASPADVDEIAALFPTVAAGEGVSDWDPEFFAAIVEGLLAPSP